MSVVHHHQHLRLRLRLRLHLHLHLHLRRRRHRRRRQHLRCGPPLLVQQAVARRKKFQMMTSFMLQVI